MTTETHSFPIVGIGASAGGLEAFRDILRFLPETTGMAFVFVQHLAPDHESLLPRLLAQVTHMRVRQVQPDIPIEANQIYVLAPDRDMTFSHDTLILHPRTEVGGQHLPIDRLLRSLAEGRATRALGVILSGMAADGTQGLQAIKAAGGMTFAQDPPSAQFDGMPQSAIATGCVDFIGSPRDIARELVRISSQSSDRQPTQRKTYEASYPHGLAELDAEQAFHGIVRLVHQHTKMDFTAYKRPTLNRRIERRLARLQMNTLSQYLTYLQDHPAEGDALSQDLLIGVTHFFRDPSTFEVLRREVLPHLLATKTTDGPLRIWVPGCSTGEEVYSLAICVLEVLAENALPIPALQFFGTDLNPRAIDIARSGIYPARVVDGLTPERLARFFHSLNGGYQIHKAVREHCIFAPQNVLVDPPFSRLDLLSCQNVLIYLKPAAQRQALRTFHYALAPHGVLLLGHSETVGIASDLFAPLGPANQQLYRKRGGCILPPGVRTIQRLTGGTVSTGPDQERHHMTQQNGTPAFDLQQETNRLLATFAPASVVVDADMNILHFHGETDPYLGPAPGRASLNLFKMARSGLDLELRSTISQARKRGQRVTKEGVQVNIHGQFRTITLHVLPLNADASDPYFLILFEGTSTLSHTEDGHLQQAQASESEDQRSLLLVQELESTRQEMRAIIGELEATNEELQTANEESLSSNEELQSLNEELETSREEMQASNEELLVVNAELEQRNTQLQEAHDFADAIVETIREPLLILDAELRVHRANRAFYRQFQVEPAETQHRLIFELGNGQWNIPSLRTLLKELLPTRQAIVDYDVAHVFPRIGHRIMQLNAQHIEQTSRILLAMEDITERTQVANEMQQMLEQRTEFMAVASHELKTPITSLKGYTQLLHTRLTRAGDERSATLLTKMDVQINRLVTQIDELLDVTRLEAGQISWTHEPFDLNTFLRECVEEIRYTTDQHQMVIEGTISSHVLGDRERIGQVLLNLLSNAVKYSPQADTIRVTVAADASHATVGVQDFGIGIAPEKHEQVFERFFRVSGPEARTFPGLGLGLFISAQIVKRHKGRMWVKSQMGVGSTFFFTIPLAPKPEAAIQ